jgi:hypothetical protein
MVCSRALFGAADFEEAAGRVGVIGEAHDAPNGVADVAEAASLLARRRRR